MLALTGVVFWAFLGISMAADKYHQKRALVEKKVGAFEQIVN